jgi:hypothetical protein
MENNPKSNMYYTFCYIIIFFNLQKVLLLHLGSFSIDSIPDFFSSNNAILCIYFCGYC